MDGQTRRKIDRLRETDRKDQRTQILRNVLALMYPKLVRKTDRQTERLRLTD